MTYLTAIQLVTTVIRPALDALPGADSPQAEQLLTGTCAQETHFEDVAQSGGGPALGLCQMEPATHQLIWVNFLDPRPDLAQAVMSLLTDGHSPTPSALIPCPQYSAAMARCLYLSCPGAIPTDLAGQAAYYKRFYNTIAGAATTDEYLANWERLVAPYAHQIWLNPPV